MNSPSPSPSLPLSPTRTTHWSRRIEIGKLLTEAVRCLTESEAEVVELEYGKELSVAEIARQKGCSRSAVRKMRAKAMAKMRAKVAWAVWPGMTGDSGDQG